jgi:hypothetical protein
MASSPPSRLTPLQQDLLARFFEREQRFFLTGGGALAGFYFGHRTTEDLDLFGLPGMDLADPAHALADAAGAAGAIVSPLQQYADFRRFRAQRGEELCIVDLVIDRAPMIEPTKARFGAILVDTLREIAANKVCTLLSRSEIKDLVDLRALLSVQIDLASAFDDAEKKDAGADPATLAFLLDQLRIGPGARLPGEVDPEELDRFREELVLRLRELAFRRARLE